METFLKRIKRAVKFLLIKKLAMGAEIGPKIGEDLNHLFVFLLKESSAVDKGKNMLGLTRL